MLNYPAFLQIKTTKTKTKTDQVVTNILKSTVTKWKWIYRVTCRLFLDKVAVNGHASMSKLCSNKHNLNLVKYNVSCERKEPFF